MARPGRKDRGLVSHVLSDGKEVWYVRLYDHGRRRQFGSFPTKTEARNFYEEAKRKQRLDLFFPEQHQRGRWTTIAELLDLVLADYQRNNRKGIGTVKRLIAFWKTIAGPQSAAFLTGADLLKMTDAWLARGIAPATVNRRMTVLRRAYHLGQHADPPLVSTVPPFQRLKESLPRKGFLEWPSFLRLREALPDYAQIPATIGFWTGMRYGEITALTWPQVMFDRKAQTVRLSLEATQTKNDEPRIVVMPGDLYETLSAWYSATSHRHPACPWVCHRRGRRMGTMDTAWKAAAITAGLGTGTWTKGKGYWVDYRGPIFHDLRRTGVRNLVRAGVPEGVAMRISGHKTRSVFERYNIVNEEDVERAGAQVVRHILEKELATAMKP